MRRPHPRLWARRFLQLPEPVADHLSADGRRLGLLTLEQAVTDGYVALGRHSYGEPRFSVFKGPAPHVTIGAFTSMAKGVLFVCGGLHHPEWVSTYPFRSMWGLDGDDAQPPAGITVGNDVWLATDSTILDGVTIGDGAVVAAGAVVTRDVRPYALVGGVPAREIRRRFDDDTIERLLNMAWWEWPDERIRENIETLCAPPYGVPHLVRR